MISQLSGLSESAHERFNLLAMADDACDDAYEALVKRLTEEGWDSKLLRTSLSKRELKTSYNPKNGAFTGQTSQEVRLKFKCWIVISGGDISTPIRWQKTVVVFCVFQNLDGIWHPTEVTFSNNYFRKRSVKIAISSRRNGRQTWDVEDAASRELQVATA